MPMNVRFAPKAVLALIVGACGAAQAQGPAAAPNAPAAPAAAASAPTSVRLNLAQAYRLALEHDAQLAAARAGTEARLERVPQARAQLLPQLSAQASQFRNDLESSTPNLVGQRVTSERKYTSSSRVLALRQPLYRPREMADYRQAKAEADQARADLDKEMQNLAVRVTTAYLQALLTHERLNLVLAQKAAYATQVDAARKAMAGGAGTRTDIDEAQARLDLAVAQELEARQDLGFTRRQLASLTNQPAVDLAPLDESRLPLTAPNPASLEAWIARAEQSSPEIRSLQAAREAAREEIAKARAGHLPTLDAVAQWSVTNSETVTSVDQRYNNKSIGVQLSVPLYQGGYVNSRTRQALAELERAEQNLEYTRRDLGLRVEREYRGVTEGILKVRALEQAVRSTNTVAESSRKSFQAGSRTLVDILNAEGQKAQALRDLADARFMYLLSRIRLLALAGEVESATIDEASGWLKP